MLNHIKRGNKIQKSLEMSQIFKYNIIQVNIIQGLNLKRRNQTTSSSKRFQRRAQTDPYGKTRARQRGERVWIARSAHKLIEIDEQYKLFPRTSRASNSVGGGGLPWRVLELGAAPGGWTEVVLDRLKRLTPPVGTIPSQADGSYHQIITCDLQPLNHSIRAQLPPQVSLNHIQDDVSNPETLTTISRLLLSPNLNQSRPTPTVILSDMLPPICGLPTRDSAQSFYLSQHAINLSKSLLSKIHPSPFDFFLLKHLQSEFSISLKNSLLIYWNSVSWVKPLACRSESREGYFLARNRKSFS